MKRAEQLFELFEGWQASKKERDRLINCSANQSRIDLEQMQMDYFVSEADELLNETSRVPVS